MKIIIIGGGCFGTFYTRELLKAKEEGQLDYSHLIIVDKNAGCQVVKEIHDPLAQIVPMEWAAYLKKYASNHFNNDSQEVLADLMVPSHWAPHLLGEMLFHRIQNDSDLPALRIEKMKFSKKIGPPYEKILANDDHAVSFATWECPSHCIEPKKCPTTKDDRDWEMGECLQSFFKDKSLCYYSFFCCHLADEVAAIPMKEIYKEYVRLKEDIKKHKVYKFAMATHSSCHGLISFMEVHHV